MNPTITRWSFDSDCGHLAIDLSDEVFGHIGRYRLSTKALRHTGRWTRVSRDATRTIYNPELIDILDRIVSAHPVANLVAADSTLTALAVAYPPETFDAVDAALAAEEAAEAAARMADAIDEADFALAAEEAADPAWAAEAAEVAAAQAAEPTA
jgi:hypothetical protein